MSLFTVLNIKQRIKVVYKYVFFISLNIKYANPTIQTLIL